jgi:hypothetical protein
MADRAADNRPLGELFSDLLQGFNRMVREEVQLARAEMSQKISQAIVYVVLLAIGAFLAYAGLLAVLAACISALAKVLPVWLSALLVGLVALALALGFLILGIRGLKRSDFKPRQTIETVKEGVEWAKRQL